MLTDWVLIGRLGMELRERIAGARVEDAGLLDDGRTAIVLRKAGRRCILAFDLFASPPMVTLEDGDLAVAEEPGFVRALARSLRGTIVADVAARRGDRLVRFRLSSRSRFGVGDEMDLYVELVPRFGNAVLTKNAMVVAAAKEFPAADNPRRSIVSGSPYELPPLPERPRTLSDAPSPPDTTRALYVYRRNGALLQAYADEIPGYADARCERAASLLDIFAELRRQQLAQASSAGIERRREALLKRCERREHKLLGERGQLAAKRRAAEHRSDLRTEGEAIFAGLHALPDEDRQSAKERAAKLFAQYRKLGKSLPHIAEREAVVARMLAAVETLRWETQRAGPDDIADVETAMAEIDPLPSRIAPPPRKAKRRLLEVRTKSGSRIIVGRSPLENANITFRIARPNDVWFHVQGVPGAHVVLSRDDRSVPPADDLEAAASLAAFHSKAQRSGSAAVDYTLRKHVRKQRDAPPGLVWYNHATTLNVRPKDVTELEQDKLTVRATP